MGELIRTLQIGSVGKDVEAMKRAVYRFLHADSAWKEFMASAPLVRQTFGPFFRLSVKQAQKKMGLPETGAIGQKTFQKLRNAGAIDAVANDLLFEYKDERRPKLLYPHPAGSGIYVGQGLHRTEGLPGNWAIDFMAPGGTAVLAPCDLTITKFSGHDPATGTHGTYHDIFGWSIYGVDAAGRSYYLTHLGGRNCFVGQNVRCGQKIASVGRWPHDPGRSHTHLGVSSPMGIGDAQSRVVAISKAPKIPAL